MTHVCKLPTKVVVFLGTLSIIGIGGIIALAWIGKEIPESLSNMAIAAASALGAILAQTRPQSDGDMGPVDETHNGS